MSVKNSFDIASLECEALKRLFHEMTLYVQNVRVEVMAGARGHRSCEEHPAATIGLTVQAPIIQIAGWLDRGQRIEAIAHELAHLLLVYRYGLGVVGRRIPRGGDSEDVFRFFMSMRGDWIYLLGQIANTVHHLMLVDYLKKEYGIESSLHLRLLHHNFGISANDDSKDKESLYAKGLIAFEYEKMIGKVDGVIHISRQTESFWQAYHSAGKHFGEYDYRSIPTPLFYEENILY
jgi:hypothetical protein